MLRSITFRDYRSFKLPTTIDIKPLTVLIGANSSGKSSIIRLCHVLASSYRSGRDHSFLNLEDGTNPADRGLLRPEDFGRHFQLKLLMDLYESQEQIAGTTITGGWASVELGTGPPFNLLTFRSRQRPRGVSISKMSLNESGRTLKAEDAPRPEDPILLRIRRSEDHYCLDVTAELNAEFKSILGKNHSECLRALEGVLAKAMSRTVQSKEVSDIITEINSSHSKVYVRVRGLAVDREEGDPEQFGYSLPAVEDLGYLTLKDLQALMSGLSARLPWKDLQTRLSDSLKQILKWLEREKTEAGREVLLQVVLECVQALSGNIARRYVDLMVATLRKQYEPSLDSALATMAYFGPLRSEPDRAYTISGIRGVLRLHEGRDLLRNKIPLLQGRVNHYLKLLGIQEEFMITRIPGKSGFPELFGFGMKHPDAKQVLSIADVGFGLSQILPVLLSMANRESKGMLVEQPELHLHPAVQSRLARVFASYAGILRDDSETEKQHTIFTGPSIIETHSEHFVRGLQVLIAQKKVLPDRVAVYSVQKDEKGRSSVRRMELDEYGLFKDAWPKGFFDQTYLQSVELLAARN